MTGPFTSSPFFFSSYGDPPDLHSFPTRRSSDLSSFLGMFNTMIIEPADPNQTDRIIRYIASNWGNFYVRMGRHKFPIITKEDGTPFYGTDYVYRSEEHTSELQSRENLVCRLLLE